MIDKPCIEMPENDFTEYREHNFITEFGYGQSEKVSFKSRGYVFTPTHRGLHGTHQLNVNQFNGCHFFSVVPYVMKKNIMF